MRNLTLVMWGRAVAVFRSLSVHSLSRIFHGKYLPLLSLARLSDWLRRRWSQMSSEWIWKLQQDLGQAGSFWILLLCSNFLVVWIVVKGPFFNLVKMNWFTLCLPAYFDLNSKMTGKSKLRHRNSGLPFWNIFMLISWLVTPKMQLHENDHYA